MTELRETVRVELNREGDERVDGLKLREFREERVERHGVLMNGVGEN